MNMKSYEYKTGTNEVRTALIADVEHAEYVRSMIAQGFEYLEGINEGGKAYYYFKRRVPVAELAAEGYPKDDLPPKPSVIEEWDLPF